MTITERGTHVPDVPPCEIGPWFPPPAITPNIDGLIALCRDLVANDPETGQPDWWINNAEFHPRSPYVAIGRFGAGGSKTSPGVSMRCLIGLLLWSYTGGGDALTSVAIDLPELLTMRALKTAKTILSREDAVKEAEALCARYAQHFPPQPEPKPRPLPEECRNLPDLVIARMFAVGWLP
ncbi:hypothetical protein GOB93_16940 [Acetobacter musti]|uniref:Phage protein n=1 Tax=Acetobacter musti TaxID=864732 RepID=A0ABX0JTI9_9PROT|nr:hypothetical protein [Acetobacter musti]NHN86310.1 hypothetical protein [Acetobacter musti]